MAHTKHVVGIVKLDAAPEPHAPFDEHIGRTLQRLRAGPPPVSEGNCDRIFPRCCSCRRVENRINSTWEDTVLLTADLRQLARDLEAEWRKYQRLAPH